MSRPDWLVDFMDLPRRVSREDLSIIPYGGDEDTRLSAVLILLGDSPIGPDILITQRASTLRSHPGQPSFPGGAIDAGDVSASAAAVREAVEETGVDPGGIDVIGELPTLWLPPSNFHVTPVIAWWRKPTPVSVVNPAEVERVERVPLADFARPENRYRIRLSSGYLGPAFEVSGMTVWGFTAGVVDRLLHLTGRELPWDRDRMLERP